jgi:signal transduction histidine kinase
LSSRSKIWMLLAAGLVLGQALAAVWLPRGFLLVAFSDTTQALLLISGTLAFIPTALASQGRTRAFWGLMAIGVGLWFAYQLLWIYFEIYLRQDVPDLFVGDTVLFLHIVPMMAALALQPQRPQDDRTTRFGSLDFALLLIWWLFLYFYTVLPWLYAFPDDVSYNHNQNVIYMTEKIVFLGGLAVLWTRSSRSWKRLYGHLFGASLVYALSSYLANWAIEKHLYYTGSLYDIPLVASMAWFTGIALWARDLPPKQQSVRQQTGHGVWVARLGMMTIFSLPLFAAWALFDQNSPSRVQTFRLLLTLSTMMLMGSLVFLKQHLLDRELLSLLRQSEQSFDNLQRLQAQLLQSEKLASLGQLVGGAAHELNNPLTAMLGYSDLLSSTQLNDDQRALASKIEQQVRRTKELVASLLSFAKQVPGEKSPLDMTALVQTALKLCQPQLRARNVEIRTNLASDLPPVLGDSTQLLQVCLHIANNALHALEEVGGGALSVATTRGDGLVAVEFFDNGPGAAEPERVFDPFYTTRPVGKGMGLGLSACYGIVQEHKGRIVCENRSEGGAVFRIELPVIGTENQRRQSPRTEVTSPLAGFAAAASHVSTPDKR